MTRRVVLIFGPPGAGKTTLAHTLGLDVYDRDDPQWQDNDDWFRAAMRQLGNDVNATAAVIRTGSTQRGRQIATRLCRPTETIVLDTPATVCIERIEQRNRGDVAWQIQGVETWWANQPRNWAL